MKFYSLSIIFSFFLMSCEEKISQTKKVISNQTLVCSNETSQVCAQPPMPICSKGMACLQVMPQPQTYDTECSMKYAGATLINPGSCYEDVCPATYEPVCGQSPMPLCPDGLACTDVMPQPQTYKNECSMKYAGATLINPGSCEEYVCPATYEPVCAQPPMPLCPKGLACIQVMPTPQTYDNECLSNASKATLISKGECEKLSEENQW